MTWLRGRLSCVDWEGNQIYTTCRKVFKHGDTLIWIRERQLQNELHGLTYTLEKRKECYHTTIVHMWGEYGWTLPSFVMMFLHMQFWIHSIILTLWVWTHVKFASSILDAWGTIMGSVLVLKVCGIWLQIDLLHFWHAMCPFKPTCHLGDNSKAECFGRPYSSLGGE